MKIQLKHLMGIALLVAAVLAPPAVVANVLAGAAGLAMLSSSMQVSGTAFPTTVSVQSFTPRPRASDETEWHLRELPQGGVVAFRQVNGKLVSRYFRSRSVR